MVATSAHGDAVAGVSVSGDELVVFVGDDASRRAGTMARLTTNGQAEVQCVQAPQAMLVRDGEVLMVPSLPGLCDTVPVDEPAYLVLCSASVLEHLPHGLAYVIRRVHEGGEKLAVRELLEEILSYTKTGGVAIIHRPRSA